LASKIIKEGIEVKLNRYILNIESIHPTNYLMVTKLVPLNKAIANMKKMLHTVVKGMMAFKRVYLGYVLVLLFSGCVYVVSSVNPNVTTILAASRSAPWGVVTSIFAHSSLSHFGLNMGGLFIFVLMFTFSNSTFSAQDKKKLETFYLFSIFAFAIISNILWVILNPNPSVGASGLVYAAMGIVTGFSLINGLQIINFPKFKTQEAVTAVVIVMNIILSILLIAQVFQDPQLFLNIGEGVNVIAHGVSFLLGLFAVFPYCLIEKVSILTKPT
jgi:membrane associated rhomboid family serine protease